MVSPTPFLESCGDAASDTEAVATVWIEAVQTATTRIEEKIFYITRSVEMQQNITWIWIFERGRGSAP